MLSVASIALLVVFTSTVLGSVLPARLMDPVWQLSTTATVINNAPVALVGLAGMHLSTYLDPGHSILRRRLSVSARLAQFAVVGFLLLVPVQLMAVWKTIQTRETVQNRQMVVADRRIAEVRRAINSSSTVEQLQAELNRLNLGTLVVRGNPADQSLTSVREKLLQSLETTRSNLKNRITTPVPLLLWQLIQSSLQLIVSAIALAAGFAALAQPMGRLGTLLSGAGKSKPGLGDKRSRTVVDRDYFKQIRRDDY